MLLPLLAVGAVTGEQGLVLVVGERPAPRAGGERHQLLEVPRLGRCLRRDEIGLLTAHAIADRLDVEEHHRRLGGLVVVVQEPLVHELIRERIVAHEVELAPQPLELGPAGIVEQEPTQRLVLTVEHEQAALRIAWNDRLEEHRRRKEVLEFSGRTGSLGGHARVHDLRHPWLGLVEDECLAGPPRMREAAVVVPFWRPISLAEKQGLDRGRFRAALIKAHIGPQESRERERLEERRGKFREVERDLRRGLRDKRRGRDGPSERMVPEAMAGGLECRPDVGMLGEHDRRRASPLQPQTIPHDERPRLLGRHLERDQPKQRIAGGGLETIAGDHPQHPLPHREAVADGEDLELVVGVPEEFFLQHLDDLHDRLGIGRGLAPRLPHEGKRGRRGAGARQIEIGAQIGERLPLFRRGDVRQLECDSLGIAGVHIGDAADDDQVAVDRTRPRDRHGAVVAGMHEDRTSRQLRPETQGLGGRVHEHRGLGPEAPRLHLGPAGVRVALLRQKDGGRFALEEAPPGLVGVEPGVALVEIRDEIGHAPGALVTGRFADRPLDERAVGAVALVGRHG